MKTRFIIGLTMAALVIPRGGFGQNRSEDANADGADGLYLKVQIFLDGENFGPGKIDGRWGEFTGKALARYQRAHGGEAPETESDASPRSFELPLEKINSPTTTYRITAADAANVGEVPAEPEAQQKLKVLPYRSLVELVAERFHADVDLIERLNEGKNLGGLREGDEVTVPNVGEPFDLATVKQRADDGDKEKGKKDEEGAGNARRIEIDVGQKMLELKEGDKLLAAFPITPGSSALPAPKGQWRVQSVTWMPWFRRDEKMLKEGERGDVFQNLPPGPNNPVGIAWIALDKNGIGIHGTNEPEGIGRSTSHGCIRLANWDAWRLGQMIRAGTPVEIR